MRKEEAKQEIRQAVAEDIVKSKPGADELDVELLRAKVAQLTEKLADSEKLIATMKTPPSSLEKPPPPKSEMACPVCGQRLSVCDGEHVDAFVGPDNQKYWKDFPGVHINGVTYVGYCKVAKSQADLIKVMTSRWQNAEEELLIGRRKIVENHPLASGRQPAMFGSTMLG